MIRFALRCDSQPAQLATPETFQTTTPAVVLLEKERDLSSPPFACAPLLESLPLIHPNRPLISTSHLSPPATSPHPHPCAYRSPYHTSPTSHLVKPISLHPSITTPRLSLTTSTSLRLAINAPHLYLPATSPNPPHYAHRSLLHSSH